MTVDPQEGLSDADAEQLLARDGPNAIRADAPPRAWRTLLAQLASPLVGLLAAAAAVCALVGDTLDAAAIGAVVVIQTAVGFAQEFKAERALSALRATTAPRARVVRGGALRTIPAAEVVVGDLLALEAGDIVAADAILRDASALTTLEAALTGESLPSDKSTVRCPDDAPLAERSDRVFMGTSVAGGTGRAEVHATGGRTELGKIAEMLAAASDERTPLERRLARVARTLALVCLLVVAAVGTLGLVRGERIEDVLLMATALAVASMPEGLSAIVTVALARGVHRMAREHALVRRLAAIETLGAATVICTDKTGTLTAGRMEVRAVHGAPHEVLAAAAACSDADLQSGVGDPTELALLAAAAAVGIDRRTIEATHPRVSTQPFDPHHTRMSVLRANGTVYVKGAPESVLPLCADRNGDTEAAHARAMAMAGEGLRVIAVASGPGPSLEDLSLLGFVGLADPPREAAVQAIADARRAGLRVMMITGDHPVTARAIAREMGIVRPGDDADTLVFARATPAMKLALVKDLKARGEVVAMTGDGVNDAPALREAHVGVAMGIAGTEVTRQASDIVLTTDDFASLVGAIREGRTVSDNLQKSLVYLFGGNAAELCVMLGAAVAGLPGPMTPLMLLWMNLVSESGAALALVFDAPAHDVLHRPPRPQDAPLVGAREWAEIAVIGVLDAGVVLATFSVALGPLGEATARTLAFTTLVCAELFRGFSARRRSVPFFAAKPGPSPKLVAVLLGLVLLQVLLPQWALARELLRMSALSAEQSLLALGLALVPMLAIDVGKRLRVRA